MKHITNKDRERCKRKVHHPTEPLAWAEHKRMVDAHENETAYLTVYQCNVCQKFCLGRMTSRDIFVRWLTAQ